MHQRERNVEMRGREAGGRGREGGRRNASTRLTGLRMSGEALADVIV